MTDGRRVMALSLALDDWLQEQSKFGFSIGPAHQMVRDAINQATKAETIEWLAAIAERYGFQPTGGCGINPATFGKPDGDVTS